MKRIKGQVKIPDVKSYAQRQATCNYHEKEPCIVCGAPMNTAKPHFVLRLGPGSRSHAIPHETPDQGGAEMGCSPIGKECMKKYPELRKLALKVNG